jgi:hypothetical protein
LQFITNDVSKVKSLEQIPFYHSIFQSHQVVSNTNAIQQTFTSSGTTGMITSKHLVTDTPYEESYQKVSNFMAGNINYVVLASYLLTLSEKGFLHGRRFDKMFQSP